MKLAGVILAFSRIWKRLFRSRAMPPLTEAETNNLRNMLGRLRQENHAEYTHILFSSIINGAGHNMVCTTEQTDDLTGTKLAVIMVFTGENGVAMADRISVYIQHGDA